MSVFRRVTSAILIATTTTVMFPLPAQAALIPTDQSISRLDSRKTVDAFLNRADVGAKLEMYGVSPAEVKARAAAMTDDEAAMLARHIDSAPAGGFVGEILGAIVLVFIVLLITDILGYTKVFPFTRSIKH
jgi:hypothetical protein